MVIRSVSQELQVLAKKELNEDPNRTAEDIKQIQNWIKKSTYLNARHDEQWIVAFLRGCKFSLERTKEKMDYFYTLKSILPEFYANRDPMLPEIQAVLKTGVYLPLPKAAGPDSPRICIYRAGAHDTSKQKIADVFKTTMMIQDILMLEDDQFKIAGVVVINDLKGTTMSHVGSPGTLKKGMMVLQEGYPARPKGIHFINTPSFFETIFNVVKPFFNSKIRSRVVVHPADKWDNLYKAIPKSILPKDYGGEGPTVAETAAHWKKKVESYREWFLEDDQYKTNEKKRPGRPKSAVEIFGIEGSFRKLEID